MPPSPESPASATDMTLGLARWFAKQIVYVVLSAVALFAPAGRLDWRWGWVYVAVLVANLAVTVVVLAPRSPDLLVERGGIGEGTKRWDVPLALVLAYGPLVIALVAGLDVRFGWSPELPVVVHLGALAVVLLGSWLTLWAMGSNRFFSGVLRIQQERGHMVATAGPYQFVRHPGYLGAVVFTLAMPLLLGSWWASIPAGVVIVVTLVRTKLEDETLRTELDGYQAYARRVRYRLLPGVW